MQKNYFVIDFPLSRERIDQEEIDIDFPLSCPLKMELQFCHAEVEIESVEED